MITLWVNFDILKDRTIKLNFESDKNLYEHEAQAISSMTQRIEKTIMPDIKYHIFDQRCKTDVMFRLNYIAREIFYVTNVRIDVQEIVNKYCNCLCTCGAL